MDKSSSSASVISASLTEIQAQYCHPDWSGEKWEVKREANNTAGDGWCLNAFPDTAVAAHQDDQSRGEADADDVADDDLPVQILEVRDGAIHQGGDEETDQTQNADSNVDIHSQTFC